MGGHKFNGNIPVNGVTIGISVGVFNHELILEKDVERQPNHNRNGELDEYQKKVKTKQNRECLQNKLRRHVSIAHHRATNVRK